MAVSGAPAHPCAGDRGGGAIRTRGQAAARAALPRGRGAELARVARARGAGKDALSTIVVTPVRNEAWILDRFLSCVSLWADHIVVADQGSTDGSREIAARHAKVTLIDNPESEYDEGARQRLLLDAAGNFSGRRVLSALAADEIPAAGWPEREAFARLSRAGPGTVGRMRWANILPGFERCWLPREELGFGFVDNGAQHPGERVPSGRLPVA